MVNGLVFVSTTEVYTPLLWMSNCTEDSITVEDIQFTDIAGAPSSSHFAKTTEIFALCETNSGAKSLLYRGDHSTREALSNSNSSEYTRQEIQYRAETRLNGHILQGFTLHFSARVEANVIDRIFQF
jgi:hypothetical protein